MIKSTLQKYPLFLLTIPFVFLINALNHYYHLLHWEYITTKVIFYLATPVLVYILLALTWKQHKKAGIVMFFLLLIFYFFSLLYDWLKSIQAPGFIASYKSLLLLMVTGLILLLLYLRKKQSSFNTFYYIANLIFIFLLLGGAIQYIILGITNAGLRNDQGDPNKILSKQFIPCDTCKKPDIYFIVLDSYTNTKTLSSEFGYSNSFIDSFLLKKNFFLSRNSKSNYNFTHMSIASELNMAYLSNLQPDHVFYTKDFLQSNYTIANNELTDILYKQGYTITNYSNFNLKEAPVKVTPYLTELTWRSVLGQTFFNKAARDIGWNLGRYFPQKEISKERRKEIEDDAIRSKEVFNGLVEAAKKTPAKPQFLYAHFLLPHETYLYDSSGKRLPVEYTAHAWINNKKDYLNQLAYVNRFIIAPAIDSIFSNARRPFIIVLQSDHGYRNYPPEKVNLEFENLNAIYFPDNNYSTLYDSMSSVNTFRIVLNKYFNQQLPLLKDSTINLYKKRTLNSGE